MNHEPAIRLSVALVTRHRPESLARALASWRAQTVPPWEIVVSDDSADPTLAAASRRVTEAHGAVYTPGPRRGLYANRNHASLLCTGSHLFSSDDDHTHPVDLVERLYEVIASDPGRVWIFTERHPEYPDTPLTCPGELHRSGHGGSPADPSRCAAISDGATVYPRGVFDSGRRYDETYPFGALWYLWGRVLVRYGWRISFSDRTFIWHWEEMENRATDRAALRKQLEATVYVHFADALWVTPAAASLGWAILYTLRRVLVPDSLAGYEVSARLGPREAARALWRAWTRGRLNR